MYFKGFYDDDRVAHALANLGDLPEIDRAAADGDLREVGRNGVRDKLAK